MNEDDNTKTLPTDNIVHLQTSWLIGPDGEYYMGLIINGRAYALRMDGVQELKRHIAMQEEMIARDKASAALIGR